MKQKRAAQILVFHSCWIIDTNRIFSGDLELAIESFFFTVFQQSQIISNRISTYKSYFVFKAWTYSGDMASQIWKLRGKLHQKLTVFFDEIYCILLQSCYRVLCCAVQFIQLASSVDLVALSKGNVVSLARRVRQLLKIAHEVLCFSRDCILPGQDYLLMKVSTVKTDFSDHCIDV